jgi:glycosyltransferase involved in cell wall biosynthesis
MKPLVSIIIPSYNRPAAFVRRAVESARNQTTKTSNRRGGR